MQVNNIFLRHDWQEYERSLLAGVEMRSSGTGAMRSAAKDRCTKDLNEAYGSKLQRRMMVVLSLKRGRAYDDRAFYKRGKGSVSNGVIDTCEEEEAWTASVSDRQLQSLKRTCEYGQKGHVRRPVPSLAAVIP